MTIRNLETSSPLDPVFTIFLKTFFYALVAGIMFFIGNAQAGVPGSTEQSIDCTWEGLEDDGSGFATCTINEPQGIAGVTTYIEQYGEPYYSTFDFHPECPKTKTVGGFGDGPSSLLIDVTPCSNTQKVSNYRYIPMDTDSSTGRLKVLKVPNGKNLGQSVEGLEEENKRLWKFMEFQKKELGVVREN